MFKERQEDKSFGLISWSKVTSSGTKLFGSDLTHGNLIALRIKQASRERGLSRTWYYGGQTIAEVYMSAHQFSEFLTSPNQGDGIPCTVHQTLKDINIPYPDSYASESEMHTREFKDRVVTIAEKGTALKERLESINNQKSVKKSDVKNLTHDLDMLLQDIRSNLPFVLESFQEEMEHTVTAGKHEIESYISNRLAVAGLEHLQSDEKLLPKLGDEE